MADNSRFDDACVDYLSFVFESVTNHDPSRVAYVDAENPSRALNIQQTRLLVRELIAGLKSVGFTAGDSALLLLANNIFYSPIFFSIIGAGGVCIGANPASQSYEIDHILQLTKPKIVITSRDVHSKFCQSIAKQDTVTRNVFILDAKLFPLPGEEKSSPTPSFDHNIKTSDTEHTQWSYLEQLTHHGEADWIRFASKATAKDTPAAMFSTSGTSGLPKVAVSSHYALICQHLSIESEPQYQISRLLSLPMFHCFAALFAHVWPIRNEQPIYILPRFHPEKFMDAIARFQITDTIMAPPIVHTISQNSSTIKNRLDTLRWVGVGGAPIAADAMQKFETYLHPHASLSQVWGMTELGWATLVRYPERQCWGSIGRALPGYEMKLIDSFGGTIENDHEPGTLLVRFHGMMTGYKDHERHQEGAWYDTGDIMARTDEKYFVVGRSKELIKVNAWQVAPAELEAVLLLHPCVKDAAVLGVVREDGITEVPRAYIVPKDSADGKCSSLTPDDVYDFARERLASYKALNGGVYFVNDIPRTASGKIQRFKLGQMDYYRRSVTELLVKNSDMISEHKLEEIAEIKAQADDMRTGNRRSARLIGSKTPVSTTGAQHRTYKTMHQRRRSKTSLADKMKALEASRIPAIAESVTVSST